LQAVDQTLMCRNICYLFRHRSDLLG